MVKVGFFLNPNVNKCLFNLGDGILIFLSKIYYKHEDSFRLWMGSSLYVVVRKKEDIETVLRKCLNRADIMNRIDKLTGGSGLLTSEGLFKFVNECNVSVIKSIFLGEKWRQTRRLVAPTLSHAIILQYVSTFHENSMEFVHSLESKIGQEQCDLHYELNAYTMSSFSKILLNNTLNPDEVKQCAESVAL